MTTSESENPKATVFRVIVNVVAQYGDSSYLQPGRLIGGTPKGYGDRFPASEVVASAVRQTEEWYEAIRDAKTKKPPSIYVMPLALEAFYPDKRQAERRHQFVTHDPATIQSTVRTWYEKQLTDLVAIGADDI